MQVRVRTRGAGESVRADVDVCVGGSVCVKITVASLFTHKWFHCKVLISVE